MIQFCKARSDPIHRVEEVDHEGTKAQRRKSTMTTDEAQKTTLLELVTAETSADKLRAFCKEHAAWVEFCIADGDHDSWAPQMSVNVLDETGKVSRDMISLHVPFNASADKHDAMRRLGLRYYAEHKTPLLIALSSEAWTSKNPQGMQPILDPNRKEVIMVQAMAIGCKFAMTSMPLARRAGKIQPAKFGELCEAVTLNLLKSFFIGFFMPAIKAREDSANSAPLRDTDSPAGAQGSQSEEGADRS
jgi:hypothetical protein